MFLKHFFGGETPTKFQKIVQVDQFSNILNYGDQPKVRGQD